ncbi:TCTP family protein [Butyriboletus roseoflavus]|nr:TCTP family protein [Butyriboletus roseoflavus]
MKAIKKKLQENNPDRVKAFETGAAVYVKKILTDIKDYDFVGSLPLLLVSVLNVTQYVGESMNPDGLVALLNYREDGITPYFTFWKDGLKEVKL